MPMRVEFAYGRTGLTVDLPDDRTTVVEPSYVPGLPDEPGALAAALRNPIGTPPLRRMVRPRQTVAISVCDITRPMPSSTVLPAVLRELAHLPKENIVILIAAGTHRANTPEELDGMLGPEVTANYRVVNHDAFAEENLERCGETPDGIPVWLNRHWLAADFKITTGFVEPHFFAGFSGGPKMVAPGLAGFETTMRLHDAGMIGHPSAVWGVTEGNPIHDAIRGIAADTGVDFSVDVTINRNHQVTSVYAGELFAVHQAACRDARRASMRPVTEPFDLVITTNSGYPLDMNLYQSVKGMSAAAQVVRDGGTIVCAAECSDGIPDHGEYKRLLAMRDSPSDLLEMITSQGFSRHDQWQVQIQAQILLKARVLMKSSYLTAEQVRAAHLEPVDDLQDAIDEQVDRIGPEGSICAIPQGPQTILHVTG